MTDNRVEVRVILRKGKAALVEAPGTRRVVVPITAVISEGTRVFVFDENLNRGIEYGMPWAEKLRPVYPGLEAEKIETALRRAGVWEAEDYYSNPGAVQSAILDLSREIIADIARVAKSARKQR